MLGTIRKFSSSVLAKIFLFIVALPFVFWGMGDLFRGGNQNVIVKIGNEKVSTKEFVNFIKYNTQGNEALDKKSIDELFSKFIGNKLINEEIKDLGIVISDSSLRKIIKNEKMFKKNNKFSRTEYEKFLIKNSIDAVTFETNIANQIKKDQLFDFIGGGVVPANFLVNQEYDKINQKRNVKVIDLNKVYKDKFKFSEAQIKDFFNVNKEKFIEIYKSVKFLELQPKILTGEEEFNELFFKKIDEIDDFIVEGKDLDFIVKKFDLEKFRSTTFDKYGKNKNSQENNDFPNDLIGNIFKIDDTNQTFLLEEKDKYFIVEVTNTEKIYKQISDPDVKNDIVSRLEKIEKRKLISEIIKKINNNNFTKSNFENFSKDKTLINSIKIENQNDNKALKKELVNQIYSYSEKKVIVIADLNLSESYLVYIDSIENASIEKNSENYSKYYNLSKVKITSNLYNSYDNYLRNKYKIDINHKALDSVKNYF